MIFQNECSYLCYHSLVCQVGRDNRDHLLAHVDPKIDEID